MPDPKPKTVSTAGQPSWMAPVTPVVPDHELVRRIGGGSYGDVWLARTTVGTWRAVKVVFRDRFLDARPYEREFNGIQKFEPLSRSNEAFIDILQIGRNDTEGYFYYVMELADDAVQTDAFDPSTYVPKTLAKVLLQRGRLPVGESLELGLTLNLGLAHLHRAGLIHRDIKPSNIIFVGGIPKLADIGLVIELGEARSFVGTEGFIPPEGPNSPQADLYSLGKVLYEVAMGKDRKDFPEPFTQIAEAADSAALLEFNAILLKACAANRDERYQSAEEMNADLALLQSGGSVRRQRKLAGQLRFVQRAGTLAALLAAVIALGWRWQAKQTRVVRELAGQKSQLVEEKTKLLEDNRNRIVRLDISNGIRLLDEGDPAGALLWFADALPLVTNNPAQESIHRIRIRQTIDQILRPVQTLPHESPVAIIALSRDGKRFASGTETGQVRVWDVRSGFGESFRADFDRLRAISFTADGERLLVSAMSPEPRDAPTHNPHRQLAILDLSGRTLFSTLVTNQLHAGFIADGRWIATAGPDHVIRVTEVSNGHQIAALNGHTNEILGFLSSIEGEVMVSFSKDRTLRVWRLPSGDAIGNPLPFDPDLPLVPSLSKDGQRLKTYRTDIPSDVAATNAVQIWRTDTMASVGVLPGRLDQVGIGWFVGSGPNRHLLNASGAGVLRVINPDSQTDVAAPLQVSSVVLGGTDFQDGRFLAVGGREGLLGVWDLKSGTRIVPPFRGAGDTKMLEVSENGSLLATVNTDGLCMLWNLQPRGGHGILLWPAKPVDRIHTRLFNAFSPERSHLLMPLEDGSVHLVDLEHLSSRQLPGTPPSGMEPAAIVFSHDHRQWAIHYKSKVASSETSLELWRDIDGAPQRLTIVLPQLDDDAAFTRDKGIAPMWSWEDGVQSRGTISASSRIVALRFAKDDASIVTISIDRQIRTFRTSDGLLEHSTLAPPTFECHEIFPDGRTIFGWDRNTGFALYDRLTGAIQPTLPNQDSITALVFDPAGERFVTTGSDGLARVWSAKTGQPLSPLMRHGGPVVWADWSADGSRLATAGFTPEVRIWNASSAELDLPPLKLGNDALQIVRWSLDGRFVVARSDENTVRVWDAATGEAVTPLFKHENFIRLAHLAANNRLVTLSLPNLLRAWDLTETRLPADVIADFAFLTSGRRLSRNAMMQPLKPAELAELCRSLRARAPELFE